MMKFKMLTVMLLLFAIALCPLAAGMNTMSVLSNEIGATWQTDDDTEPIDEDVDSEDEDDGDDEPPE